MVGALRVRRCQAPLKHVLAVVPRVKLKLNTWDLRLTLESEADKRQAARRISGQRGVEAADMRQCKRADGAYVRSGQKHGEIGVASPWQPAAGTHLADNYLYPDWPKSAPRPNP